MHKIGLGIVANTAAPQRQGRIADCCGRYSRDSNIDGFGFHMLAVQRDAVPSLAEITIAPWNAVAADDVDLSVGTSQLDQEIMQQVEFLDVVVLYIAGAVVAEKMVQLSDAIREILIANTIDYVEVFAGMEVIKTKPVGRRLGWGCCTCRFGSRRRTKRQECCKANKQRLLEQDISLSEFNLIIDFDETRFCHKTDSPGPGAPRAPCGRS